MNEYRLRTVRDPGYRFADDRRLTDQGWPEFMLHDAVADRYFMRLYEDFPDFQFILYDGEIAVAVGNSIPLSWDMNDASLPDAGWDWAIESGFALKERGSAPTTLCALSITIARSHVGQGVSKHALEAMKALAARHRFNALIAPVRPSLKHLYPLAPMERYARWMCDDCASPDDCSSPNDGAPFDPWLRAHWRGGARLVRVAPRSMVIPGTVAQWESWTGMKFPESGVYVVPHALNPVSVDLEGDAILYVEPNVWMHHPIS